MKGYLGSSSGSNVNRNRLVFVGAVFIIIFIIYLTHLFSLQIVNTVIYKKKATDVAQRSDIIPAQRGKIYDRDYDFPFAVNIDSFAILITPANIEDISIGELIHKLSLVLNVTDKELRKKIPTNEANQYQAVEILSGVSFEKVAYIAEHIDEFQGVTWSSKPLRFYNQTGSISHVLGYLGGITTSELQILYNQGYSYNSVLGKTGIEKQYDMILKGQDGRRLKIVDVKGRGIENKEDIIEPPQNGMNLRLTIDKDIQILAEKALGPRMGSVIVLQPSTGEVLAMVSSPSFNPNKFSLPGPTNYGVLSLDENFPFLNRAIQSTYPPASTFKIISTAAILDLGNIDPEKTIVCEGSFKIGNRVVNCHKKSGHGALNLKEALGQSCNVYFGTVGMELGIDNIAKYAQSFGLSAITGIDLPGEVSGNIPTKAWKEREYNDRWQLGDTINVSIGQGAVTSTPLQVANESILTAKGKS